MVHLQRSSVGFDKIPTLEELSGATSGVLCWALGSTTPIENYVNRRIHGRLRRDTSEGAVEIEAAAISREKGYEQDSAIIPPHTALFDKGRSAAKLSLSIRARRLDQEELKARDKADKKLWATVIQGRFVQ